MLKLVSVALSKSRKGQTHALGAVLPSGKPGGSGDLFDISGFLRSKNQAVGGNLLSDRPTTMMDLIKGPKEYVEEINKKVQVSVRYVMCDVWCVLMMCLNEA